MVSVDEEDGSNVLYCNARSPLGYRVQALSLDDGAVFQEGQLVQRLVEPRNGCHGSVVGFPAPLHLCKTRNGHTPPCRHWTSFMAYTDHTHSLLANSSTVFPNIPSAPEPNPTPDFLTPTWVVYSHPTWTTARKDLGVFLSLFPRDPDSWRGPWVIYEGPSAYSDLAYLELSPSPGEPPAVAFACLFECGTKTAYDEISFCLFSLYELIDNLPGDAELGTKSKDNKAQQAAEVSGKHEPRRAPGIHQMPHVKKRRKSKLMKMCSIS